MAFHILVLFSLLNLAFAGSQAALLPEEVHWKKVFPNTLLPKALKDLLPQTADGNYGGHQVGNFGNHQDGDYGNHQDGNYSNHQDGNYGIHQDGNYGNHQDGNYGSHIDGNYSKHQDGNYGNHQDGNYGNHQDGNYGNHQDGNYGNHQDGNYGSHQDGNYGSHQDGNYGNHQDGNYGIHQDGNYGNQESKSGEPFKHEDSTKGNEKSFKEINVPAANYNSAYGEEDSTKTSEKSFKEINVPASNYNNAYGDEGSTKASEKSFKEINVPASNYNNAYGDEDSTKASEKSFKGNKENTSSINETVYFFQEDLYSGKMVKLSILTTPRDLTPFMPHPIAYSIPFSSDKLPEIFKHFSVEPESSEAYAMKETIKGCERDVIRGEEMYCATSFESFVDSSVSKLGNNIQLLSHEIGKETKNPVFTIGSGIKNMGEKELVCHKMDYPYAVFLCHSIDKTVVYKIPLVSIDGTRSNALAVCHKDTSAWNPKHTAFQILKVKPGTVPICHFVMIDTLIWVSY